MKTAELIDALAAATPPARPAAPARKLLIACLIGAAVAAVAMLAWLGLRPMHEAMAMASFWMKAAYALILSAVGLALVVALARPGGRPGAAPLVGAAAVAAMAVLAALQLARASPADAPALLLGHSWPMCSMRIAALAVPAFAALVVALRRLAPTRLALAGAAAGLTAGAVGASVYGLSCQETAAAFVVIWYTLGIGACAAVGALLGPRLLRW